VLVLLVSCLLILRRSTRSTAPWCHCFACAHGENRGILTKLARQYGHMGDKHDSTYALGLKATRKATVTSMQATGIASKLMWIYRHHDPDSQWFGNWVLLHVQNNDSQIVPLATSKEWVCIDREPTWVRKFLTSACVNCWILVSPHVRRRGKSQRQYALLDQISEKRIYD